MPEADDEKLGQRLGRDAASAPLLLLTAKQELEFAYEHDLLAWNFANEGYPVIQLIAPDKNFAEALQQLIEAQHGKLDNLGVRQSDFQQGQWVVQMPLWQADKAGLLPHGLKATTVHRQLPKRATGNPADVEVRAAALAKLPAGASWLSRLMSSWRGQDRSRD